jgi:hypothetical protein
MSIFINDLLHQAAIDIRMTTANIDFYKKLVPHKGSLSELLKEEKSFVSVPADWHVIVTDITNSTGAVAGGRHEDVNLIATGSIVAVLNIAFGMDISVPFFFGGDGSTFIVPTQLVEKAMQALQSYRENTFDNFNLELRTGIVPVEKIYEADQQLCIAKYNRSADFHIPIVLGNGLSYAEQLIKAALLLPEDPVLPEEEPDLTGMQCRWDKISPPADKEEVVTLLILAREAAEQSKVFSKVLTKLDELYGGVEKRQPISVNRLKLQSTFKKISTEMRAKLGKMRYLSILQTWFTTLLGYIYFRTSTGKTYLQKLVEMSDTLVIDGRINTVISGVAGQRKILEAWLDELESNQEIIYGIYVSKASVMSCYVRDMKDGHIHFVDGAEGGYTQAAKMLKKKLKIRN